MAVTIYNECVNYILHILPFCACSVGYYFVGSDVVACTVQDLRFPRWYLLEIPVFWDMTHNIILHNYSSSTA
jgi:hypothetical protein